MIPCRCSHIFPDSQLSLGFQDKDPISRLAPALSWSSSTLCLSLAMELYKRFTSSTQSTQMRGRFVAFQKLHVYNSKTILECIKYMYIMYTCILYTVYILCLYAVSKNRNIQSYPQNSSGKSLSCWEWSNSDSKMRSSPSR